MKYPVFFALLMTIVFVVGDIFITGNEFNYFQTFVIYLGAGIVGELTLLNSKTEKK